MPPTPPGANQAAHKAFLDALMATPMGRKVAERLWPTIRQGGIELADAMVGSTEKTGRINRRAQQALMRHATAIPNSNHLADMDAKMVFGGLTADQVQDYGLYLTTVRLMGEEGKGNLESRIPRLTAKQLNQLQAQPWFKETDKKYRAWQTWTEKVNREAGQETLQETPGGAPFAHLWPVSEGQPGALPMYFDQELGVNVPFDLAEEIGRRGRGKRGTTPTQRERQGRVNRESKREDQFLGHAESYETDPIQMMRRWYASTYPTWTKRNLVKVLQEEGLALPADAPNARLKNGKAIFNGIEFDAAPKDFMAPVIHPHGPEVSATVQGLAGKVGKQPISQRYILPKDIAREVEDVDEALKPLGGIAKAWQEVRNPVTGFSLKVPGISVMHLRALMQVLSAQPLDGKMQDRLADIMTSSIMPVGTYRNALERFHTPEGQAFYRKLLTLGGVRPNSFEGFQMEPHKGKLGEIVDAPEQWVFGDPLNPPKSLKGGASKHWGMESQIRTAAGMNFVDTYKRLHGKEPAWPEIVNYVNMVGSYSPALMPQWVRAGRNLGADFLAHQFRQIPAEAGAAAGLHKVPTKGLSTAQKAELFGKTIANAWLPSVLAITAGNYFLNGGKKPDHVGPFDIYVPSDKSLTGKDLVIRGGSMFRLAGRGSEVLGVNAALESAKEEGGIPKNFGRHYARALGNVALEVPGPTVKAIAQTVTNKRLRLNPDLNLQRFTDTNKNVLGRAAETAIQQNSAIAAMSGAVDPKGDHSFGYSGDKPLAELALKSVSLLGGPRIYEKDAMARRNKGGGALNNLRLGSMTLGD